MLEAGEPGGIATRDSWAWINASWGNPEPYFRLRMRSIAEWHRLQKDVPALARQLVRRADLGSARSRTRRLCGGARRLGPSHPPRDARRNPRASNPISGQVPDHAYHVAGEGMLEPLAAARALLAAAKALGAEVLAETPVKWLRRRGPGHRRHDR